MGGGYAALILPGCPKANDSDDFWLSEYPQRVLKPQRTINTEVEAEIGKPKRSEGLLVALTRSFAPANTISWLSISSVPISPGIDLWGKETVQGPHMFSEQAGTSCPCYSLAH